MGLFDLLKQQEQGIFGEGNFGSILGDLQRTFSGDQLKMSVGKLFNLKNYQAEQIAGMSAQDAARIGSQEDINRFLKDNGDSPITINSGQGASGTMSRRMAELNDWFASNGVKAIRKIDEYIGTYEKGGMGALSSKMMEDITGAIERGFNKATDYLREQLSAEAIDKRLGLGKAGATDINGNPLEGTVSSVGNVFDANTFFGGGSSAQRQRWISQGFNYDQNKIMPPAITTYEPQYSSNLSQVQTGADGIRRNMPLDAIVMKGNELAGNLKGKDVEAILPDKKYGELTAAQVVQLFAYAVQNGLEKITLEQSEMILKQGFQPSIEVMKQLQIQNSSFNQNKTYSTEK
jgi:hypothetical protein